MVIMVMFTNLAKYGTPSCTSNSNGLPRFQQKETVEHLEGLVIGRGALGLLLGLFNHPKKVGIRLRKPTMILRMRMGYH